jgi:hypothetical protein
MKDRERERESGGGGDGILILRWNTNDADSHLWRCRAFRVEQEQANESGREFSYRGFPGVETLRMPRETSGSLSSSLLSFGLSTLRDSRYIEYAGCQITLPKRRPVFEYRASSSRAVGIRLQPVCRSFVMTEPLEQP